MNLKKLQILAILFCSTALSTAFAQQLQQRNAPYRLQNSDVLQIQYRYTPEFNQEVTIRPDGRITVTGMGEMMAAGMTLDEVTTAVTDISKTRLKDPQVTVTVKEFQKPFIFVGGEVASPGRFELRGNITAIEAVSLAGGFKNSAKHSQVLLLRKIDGEHAETRLLDLKELIASRKLEEDINLRSGDMLYVPQNAFSKLERVVHLGQFGMLYSPVH